MGTTASENLSILLDNRHDQPSETDNAPDPKQVSVSPSDIEILPIPDGRGGLVPTLEGVSLGIEQFSSPDPCTVATDGIVCEVRRF